MGAGGGRGGGNHLLKLDLIFPPPPVHRFKNRSINGGAGGRVDEFARQKKLS